MGRVKCALGQRGRPSAEWSKDGKPQYYCHGYIDKKTDDLLPEYDRAAYYAKKEAEHGTA